MSQLTQCKTFDVTFYNQVRKNYYHLLLCQFTYSILERLVIGVNRV